MVGATREVRGENSPGQSRLSGLSHMPESMLQLPQVVIEPAVTFLVTDHMHIEKRRRINFSAAFGTFHCSEIVLSQIK